MTGYNNSKFYSKSWQHKKCSSWWVIR